MNREEVCKLFDLLEDLYQGKRRARDARVLAIWSSVLEPWSYEQVRDAAVKRSRTNRYFPDPSELAELLPKDTSDTSERRRPPTEAEWNAVRWLQKWAEEDRRRELEADNGPPVF